MNEKARRTGRKVWPLGVDRTAWPLVVIVLVPVFLVVWVGLLPLLARSCASVPEFSAEQLKGAVIERLPAAITTTVDLSQSHTREELLAAYAELHPWGDEQGRVSPDVELRLQLVDGRTIGVAAMEGSPEMLVRVYRAGKIQSELHVSGTRMMYDFFYPDSELHYPYYTGTT